MNPPHNPLKIRLQTPPAQTPAGDPAGSAPEEPSGNAPAPAAPFQADSPEPSPQTPPFRPRRGIGRWLVHSTSIAAMVFSGLMLWGWNLGVRLPAERDQLTVYARARNPTPDRTLTRTPLNPAAIDGLRRQVQKARAYLIQDNAELVQWVSDIEASALEHGWRAEVSLQPARAPSVPLSRARVIPAELILVDQPQPGTNSDQAAYFRLLAFLRQVSSWHKKMEITELNLRAGPNGLQTAETKWILWIDQSDAPTSAK